MKNYSVICLWACMVFSASVLNGQVAINTFSTVTGVTVPGATYSATISSHAGSVNGITPSTNYNVAYNNNGNIRINGFTYSSKSYVQYATFDTVIIRRVANAYETTNGNKQHIYCQGNASVDNVTYNMPFPVAFPQVSGFAFMEKVMKDGLINRGSDNLFNNDAASDLTFNNIERVDFVHKVGITTPYTSAAGFLIAERGGNDAFKIAAITAIDANGNPTAFGPVLSVSTSSYGTAIATMPTYVMRKDVGDNNLRPFSVVGSQQIRSVFIRLSDLGVAGLQQVYGYSLMSPDVTATTSAQLLNFANAAYFPTNTTSAVGGMDLASAPGIYHTDQVLAVHFLDMKVQEKNGEQQLRWMDEEYASVKTYVVEKSVNGEDFYQLAAVNPASGAGTYSCTDKHFNSAAYYRIKVLNQNGTWYYSGTHYARFNQTNVAVSLFPNPATDFLTITVNDNQSARISIFAADGRAVGNWTTGNSQLLRIDLQNLPRGNYFVKVETGNRINKTLQFVRN